MSGSSAHRSKSSLSSFRPGERPSGEDWKEIAQVGITPSSIPSRKKRVVQQWAMAWELAAAIYTTLCFRTSSPEGGHRYMFTSLVPAGTFSWSVCLDFLENLGGEKKTFRWSFCNVIIEIVLEHFFPIKSACRWPHHSYKPLGSDPGLQIEA